MSTPEERQRWEDYGCEGSPEYRDCSAMSDDYARLRRLERRVEALAASASWVPLRTDRTEVTRHVRMVKADDITAALAEAERDHVAEADAIRKQVRG